MRPAQHQPDLLEAQALGRARCRQPALVQGAEAVGQFQQFVQVLRDDDYPGLVAGQVQKRLPDLRGRAGIDAPGRLVDDQHARLAQDLAADDEFLQVPARQRPGGGAGAGGADVEGPDHGFGKAPRRAVVDQPVPHQALPRAGGQERVLGQREFGHGGMAQPVLGRGQQAQPAPRLGAHGGKVGAVHDHGARRGRLFARQRGQQRLLPVAGDAADAQDLARAERQRDAAQPRGGQARDRQDLGPRHPAGTVDDPHLGPDHHRRQFARGMGARIDGAHHLAVAQDGSAVAMRADLVQLVADIQDRRALRGQLAQGGEQDLGLLRGQDRGRLVHDEQARILQQAADDLDPLPLARRQAGDAAGGVQRQAIGLADLGDAAGQVGARRRVLHPQRHVLGHGQRVEQRKMLEHHGDAGSPRRARIGRRVGGAQKRHRAVVGPHQAIDHLDQRGLAGAVLAQQGVDLARADGKADSVIGAHAGIGLAQALGLENIGHDAPLSFFAQS